MRSRGQNESNSHPLARIGEKKIFHETDVHHVYKVGIKRFCAQDAEISLTAMNQTFLGSEGRNKSNSHQLARNGEKKIFDEHDVDHV